MAPIPTRAFVLVFLLKCFSRVSSSGQALSCCDNGRVLDLEKLKCIVPVVEFVTETYTEEKDAINPLIQCSHGWANFTTDTRPTGVIVEPKFNQTLAASEYCVDLFDQDENENKTTIVYCLPTPLKIQKCCPFGYALNRTSISECVPAGKPFNASVYVKPLRWPVIVQPNISLTCDYDYNLYLPQLFVDHRFSVLTTGELNVPAALYKVFRHITEYCVDSAVRDTGGYEPVAVTCLPWRMYIVRHILWGYFPYTQFISAFLLLVTFIIYVAFPTLRNNIQGQAMICFLFCMFIVQMEYGALLALPTEPHTWCYFKLYISTFFRYASSTWITVMGFVIWRKLSYPRNSKKNQWVEFLLLSIYAWGIPLILNLIVVWKINSLGKPPGDMRICWFSNSTVRLLMHMPNVVLVTLNLIFFIPSAIKVYGSLKFLRKSVAPVALSKLEKQRIATIFRFFLLMQFYTIPRIVHEIVDLDAMGPEYVVISITLYQLIGPAMFYFFICKVEVFRLVSKAIGGEKLGKSWSTISSRISSSFSNRSQTLTINQFEKHQIPEPAVNGSFKFKGEANPCFINVEPSPSS